MFLIFGTTSRIFVKLPYEEKKKLWQQPNNHEDFGQLFVVDFRLGEGRFLHMFLIFGTTSRIFVKLPYEEKKKLWQQPNNHEDFGQLFVVGFRLGEGRLVRQVLYNYPSTQHREE
jgi:hypothetical protein